MQNAARTFIYMILVLGFVKSQTNKSPKKQTQTSDFIRKDGYPAETHEVRTKDGYYLTIFRIPYSRLDEINRRNNSRPAVLLQHGVILNSDSWVFRGPNQDIAYLLSDAGYDVWLGNSRGTDYSRHKIYTKKDSEFWDYSTTETGVFDLPAMIDYVLNTTGRQQLSYVGHSRGNAMMAIMMATQPEYNQKVNLYISWAPVLYSREARTAFLQLASNGRLRVLSSFAVGNLMKRARLNSLFTTNKNMRQLMGVLCGPNSFLNGICSSAIFLINGDDLQMYNRTLTSLMITRFTTGISAKEYVHLLQIRESDIFRAYDYGKKGNFKIYGAEEPPEFDIHKIQVPTYIYYGANDFFVSERDLYKFALQLPNLKKINRVPYRKFNHVDYMWAKVATKELYPDVISTINAHNEI